MRVGPASLDAVTWDVVWRQRAKGYVEGRSIVLSLRYDSRHGVDNGEGAPDDAFLLPGLDLDPLLRSYVVLDKSMDPGSKGGESVDTRGPYEGADVVGGVGDCDDGTRRDVLHD